MRQKSGFHYGLNITLCQLTGLKASTDLGSKNQQIVSITELAVWAVVFIASSSFESTEKKIYGALHHGKLHRLCTFKISSDDLALFSRSIVYFLLKF